MNVFDIVLQTVTCLVITLICIQFVASESYEYEEDVDKENEYSNYPSFGLRESSSIKVKQTRSHNKEIEVLSNNFFFEELKFCFVVC